ncbi:MAG: VWA domain-containing protein [Bryobacteraceae bacterium]
MRDRTIPLLTVLLALQPLFAQQPAPQVEPTPTVLPQGPPPAVPQAEPSLPPGAQRQTTRRPTFSLTTNVVIVNVSVLDRNGKPIETLTKDDFQLFEDGKPQTLQSVDLERLGTKPLPAFESAEKEFKPREPTGYNPKADVEQKEKLSKYQDRRLIAFLFDFTSMQPPEQIRARDAALKFIKTQLTTSDLVSVMVFGSELKTILDFTPDRDLLISTIMKFRIGDSSELATMGDTGADPEDVSGQFVADDTEFNIFNTDRKLAALEDAARKLAMYPEKKALVYFSSGVEKTGVENQSQLRATVNTANRANVSFYPIDARGLSALVPGGDATAAAPAGSNLYSGAGQKSLRDSFINQQETLYTLADDTGGKALLDSNDLTEGITQVQKDVSSYYVLAYASTNTAFDGRYRKITVKLSPKIAALKPKLDYRQGYYGPTTFARLSNTDKEAQLQTALESENPVTDLPIAVEIDYFRLEKGKYFVPVSARIPGSALILKSKGSKQATELDFIGEVRDARNRVASEVRDTIPLKLDSATAGVVTHKQIQYDTGFTLPPGKYTLHFVARENGDGKVGTFEAPFVIPDLGSGNALRVSSPIFSNQREPVTQQIASAEKDKKLLKQNPLIDSSGQKIVPNITRVFRPGQSLLVYFEVYDPAIPENMPANFKAASIVANLAFYRDGEKVFESKPVRANRLNTDHPEILPMNLQLPVSQLTPGRYTCQLNVIDEFGKKFAFPRTSMVVMAADKPAEKPPEKVVPATIQTKPSE